MRIIFTRHGESLANTLHIIANRDLPHPLTEKGRTQAAALAEKLAGRSIVRIYVSPILRARETAEIVSAPLDLPVETADALREYDCGILEGCGDEAAWATHRQFVNDWLAGKNRGQALEGGETFFDIQKRVAEFVNGLVTQHNGSNVEILCVSHGGTIIFGLPEFLPNLMDKSSKQRTMGAWQSEDLHSRTKNSRGYETPMN
jgi:2,3-bisphosphoglycerate-dependent phosphoglycerate mutase